MIRLIAAFGWGSFVMAGWAVSFVGASHALDWGWPDEPLLVLVGVVLACICAAIQGIVGLLLLREAFGVR